MDHIIRVHLCQIYKYDVYMCTPIMWVYTHIILCGYTRIMWGMTHNTCAFVSNIYVSCVYVCQIYKNDVYTCGILDVYVCVNVYVMYMCVKYTSIMCMCIHVAYPHTHHGVHVYIYTHIYTHIHLTT